MKVDATDFYNTCAGVANRQPIAAQSNTMLTLAKNRENFERGLLINRLRNCR